MSDRTRLVVASALMLFVELALIRWAGSNVVYLSYFSNFVLLGSFLGIGIGFLRARASTDLPSWAPIALAFFIALVQIARVEIDRTGGDLIFFGSFQRSGLPIWVMLPLVFLGSALVMSLIAEGVGRIFIRFSSLEAYRLDISGSIIGIVLFSALSLLHAPPVFWGVVAAVGFLVLIRPLRAVVVVATLSIAVMLLDESLDPRLSWSPYYRVDVQTKTEGSRYAISVNGIPHQEVGPMSDLRNPPYSSVYQRLTTPGPANVLVVGAGNGNDVAVALANGATHVDAVEIDPRLQQLGVELHPEHPYADSRVTAHIQDGRAFLEQTDSRYDLIVFALPDSLTLVSGQSALRLESYLFTIEAMKEAREHLTPNGVYAMYNYYREGWLVDRLARTLDEAYGHPPCVDSFGRERANLAVMTISDSPSALNCTGAPIAVDAPTPSTDDHPFLYLRTPSIPGFYLLTIALILLASVVLVRGVGGPLMGMRSYADLFFMGIAFLLLETSNVVRFALLFGTTWLVNALVFIGILVSVLVAVEIARRVTIRRPGLLYVALALSIAVAALIPLHSLLGLSFAPRFLGAIVLSFTPIFIANLIFAQRFASVGDSTTAFGANLLGAMLGGVLEYGALITGYRALLAGVAVIYGLAFLAGRRSPPRE